MRRSVVAALAVSAVGLAACGTTAPLKERLELQAVANGQALGQTLPGATVATGSASPEALTTDAAGAPVPAATDGAVTGPGATSAATVPGSTVTGPQATVAGPSTPATSTPPRAAATGRPTTAASAAATAKAPTGPIQIGFTSTDTGNASALGVASGTTVSNTAVIKAAVAAMNAAGGVDGRQIVPVIATTDTGGSNWANEFQAACSQFTEDNHVTAVLGYAFIALQSFEQCLADAKVPHLNEGYEVGDVALLAQYPGLFSLGAPSVDRAELLNIAGPLASGELTTKNKLGIILSACNAEPAAWQRTVVPFIAQEHLTVASTVTLNCANGAGDAGAIAAQVSSAVLKFESAGVDRVMISSVPTVLFAAQAESQGYHPDYIVTSEAPGAGIEQNVSKDQLQHFHGYGFDPAVDTDPAHQAPQTAPQKKCLAMMKSQGLVPQQYNDFALMYTTCDSLFLYDAALRADGGRTDLASVIGAINGLGTSYQSVMGIGAASTFSAGRHDATSTYQDFDYSGDCSCFEYTGSPRPIPSS